MTDAKVTVEMEALRQAYYRATGPHSIPYEKWNAEFFIFGVMNLKCIEKTLSELGISVEEVKP